MAQPVVSLRHVSKTFDSGRALSDVSLDIAPGEIHGLLGENGSGKSTLIKILAGFHEPDAGGELRINGQAVPLPLRAGQFRALGLAFVHQDLGLVPTLSAVENLRVRILAPGGQRRISWAHERRRARQLFAEFDLDIDPSAAVAELTATEQALLAIARALDDIRTSCDGEARGLLVLDETSVFLPDHGRKRLFSLMRTIARSLASVLFVSHDLSEIQEVTDRVTVLRDGQVAGTGDTKGVSEQRLVEMIIGRSLGLLKPAPPPVPGDGKRHVRVTGAQGEIVREASFEIERGEILGVTGLVGSGYDEIPYLLFGGYQARAGQLSLGDRTFGLRDMTPARAVAERIALIPADRLRDGSAGALAVGENVTLQVLDDYRPWRLQRRAIEADARRALRTFDVRPDDPEIAYETLSGGNQQKVLLAKWLLSEPEVVLLHEPTHGVDVGAREQIFQLIRTAAGNGAAVLVASNDLEQLVAVCQRVLVFAHGVPARELSGPEITKERLSEESFVLAEEPNGKPEGAA